MIAPHRSIVLASPVILRHGSKTQSIVGGEFSIEIEVGREFGVPTKAIKQDGTFSILATTPEPVECSLPASAKVTAISYRNAEAD